MVAAQQGIGFLRQGWCRAGTSSAASESGPRLPGALCSTATASGSSISRSKPCAERACSSGSAAASIGRPPASSVPGRSAFCVHGSDSRSFHASASVCSKMSYHCLRADLLFLQCFCRLLAEISKACSRLHVVQYSSQHSTSRLASKKTMS